MQDGEARRVVDIERRGGEFAGGAGDLREIALGEKPLPHVPQVDPRARTQHPQNQRLRTHFQTEHAHRQLLINGHSLGNVHGERGFAHRGTGRDDDHFAAVHPGRHLVQVGKAGGDAGQHPLVGVVLFKAVDGLMNHVLDEHGLRLHALFAQAKNVRLHFIHERVHFALVLIHARHHVGAGGDHFPQNVFLADDVDVEREVRRARHHVRQRGEVGDAADGFELLLVLQPLLHGDDVNGLLAVIHLEEQLVDGAVAQVVKHVRPLLELLDALAQTLVRHEKHAAQHALLGFGGMRRQPVNGRDGTRLVGIFLATAFAQICRGSAGLWVYGIKHAGKKGESRPGFKGFLSADVHRLLAEPGNARLQDGCLLKLFLTSRCCA